MKKYLSIILALIIMLMPFTAFAQDNNTRTEFEYYEDGCYAEIIIEEEPSLTRSSTKTGTKSVNYRNSDGKILWTVAVKGTFSYTGSSATCTASSVSYTINDSGWKKYSATASKSGRTATGKFVMKYYVLGINTKTVNKTLTLSCSNSGTLS